jgi:hypothetical protein
MNRILILLSALLFLLPFTSLAQKDVKLDFAKLQTEGKLDIGKREVLVKEEDGKKFLKFVGNGLGGGVIWLDVDQFQEGKIELVARGMNVLQGSFVGVAFHSVNDSAYDYVYCRPFNFRTTDSLRRIHMVQYVHPPKYEWQYLRKNENGKYEKGIANPPEIDAWFKLTLVIDKKTVKAFINDEKTPTLVVDKLNVNSIGRVGVSGTGADIESIRIEYKPRHTD